MNLPEKPKKGSLCDSFGIDRPTEWLRENSFKAYSIIREHSDDAATLICSMIQGKASIFILADLGPELWELAEAFFALGFIKGVCLSEETFKPSKLMEE